MSDVTVPQNIDAEKCLLGVLLARPDTLADIRDVGVEAPDFYVTRHGMIYEVVSAMWETHQSIDLVTVTDELERQGKLDKVGGAGYVSSLLSDAPQLVFADRYAVIVKRMAWLRGLIVFSSELAQKSFGKNGNGADSIDEVFAWAHERLQHLTPKNRRDSILYGWDTTQAYDAILHQRIDEAKAGRLQRYEWPRQWYTWGRRIRPLRPGQLAVIAAPDGIGKSLFLESIAEGWAQNGLQTVLVHFEDDHALKLDRRMARWSGITLEVLEDGRLGVDEMRRRESAEASIRTWAESLHYLHTPGWTMAQVVRELRAQADDGQCQAVVLDYIDKAQPDRRQERLFGDNVWERQSDSMEQLKSFVEQAKVPVVTATQGNKAMMGAGMQTRQHIAGSGAKSQKAQLVIILTRDIGEDGVYSPVVKVHVDKQNRGLTGSFEMVIDGARFRAGDKAK